MNLKKEDRLLLDCLGVEDSASPLDAGSRLTASDLKGAIEQALRHYITPLLYQRLKRFDSSGVIPSDTMQALHENYNWNAARNIRLFHHLSKALKTLNNAGIPFIVLKGAHLAEVVYRKAGERVMEDVDLLFRKNDLALCMKILKEVGYYPYSSQLPLDIHWDIDLTVTPLSIDIKEIWDRAQPEIIAGVETLVLSPEDLLLHLCVHLAFHHLFRFTGLRTFYDIKETIRHYQGQIEWEQVRHRARKWGAGNAIYLTLSFSRDLLHAQVPDSILSALEPEDSLPEVKSWALRQVFQKRYTERPLSPYFWKLWKSGSAWEKINPLLKLLFTPPEFLSQEYPTSYGPFRSCLYYLVRFKDHFLRYGRSTWRMLTNEEKMIMLAERENRDMAMREWLSPS
ncbi:MAG: nucleotidyltransferase family protein [Deltaproteobacteria bacterium]|nr:nucleotidyltransferase family protein [Deltaproteobacteria bacterium]